VVRRLGILAVAKALIPVKAKLWVRAGMPKSDRKHRKTKLTLHQKKEDTKSSCYSISKLYDNSIVFTAGTAVSLP